MEPSENPGMPPVEPEAQHGPLPEEPLKIIQPTVLPQKRTGVIWRVIVGILLGLSVLANMFLLLALVGMAVLMASGYQEGSYRENVIQPGPRDRKVAIITLEGIIDDRAAENIGKQVERARRDRSVKAVILEINSPGGGVAASDRINRQLNQLREEGNIRTVACMKDVAASGGYYTAVGCEKIVAEPTTITGSIGVIMSSFVVQELLENKLGIQPIVIKAGAKKDWPSPFSAVTEEQRAYLQERLIQPAYRRFVEVVAEGRPKLTSSQVEELSDGSIYTGDLAEKVGLVDRVGYLKDAIEEAMQLAELKNAMVVRYKQPFTLVDVLMGTEGKAGGIFRIDRSTIYELSTPQLMYLWSY